MLHPRYISTYSLRLSAGLCIRCSAPRQISGTATLCAPCADKMRDANRKRLGVIPQPPAPCATCPAPRDHATSPFCRTCRRASKNPPGPSSPSVKAAP